jgi:DNA-binding transcriptional LysR family regulator
MELRQLTYFVAVAEARHFGRAARALRIAPPSLSQQIRVLERDLGVALLDRDTRGVRLTPAGATLLGHARAMLARAEVARSDVRAAVPEVARVALRVAPGVQAVIGPALRGPAALQLGIEVTVALCPDADAVHAVRQERAGVAVVWDGAAERSGGDARGTDGLSCSELARVPVVAVLPLGHPLVGCCGVSPATLAESTVLVPDRDLAPALWDGVVARLAVVPDRLRVVGGPGPGEMAAAGGGAVLREVNEGRGVALLPEPMLGDGAGVVLRQLDPPLDVGLVALWREPAGPGVQRVLGLLGRR